MCTVTHVDSDSPPACWNPDETSEASSFWCNEDMATKGPKYGREWGLNSDENHRTEAGHLGESARTAAS